MGFYAVVDLENVQTSQPLKQSTLDFTCPPNTCIVGRMHTGDENGNTQFKYAPLIPDPNSGVTGSITLTNATWTGEFKQSDFDYNAPNGYVITGWQHSGDENGKTSFQYSQVTFSASTSCNTANSVVSGSIKESAGVWWTGQVMGQLAEFLTGTSHEGDENGTTTYTGSLIWCNS